MARVAIAIGSNVGDRAAHLAFATHRLGLLLDNLRVSMAIETEPAGVPDSQPPFLNAAATGETSASAAELLAALMAIERDRGRERPFPGARRTLDLDLILFDGEIVDGEGLTVPHPRFRERLFVLKPLADIAPDLVDPVSGKTVRELLQLLMPAPPAAAAPRR